MRISRIYHDHGTEPLGFSQSVLHKMSYCSRFWARSVCVFRAWVSFFPAFCKCWPPGLSVSITSVTVWEQWALVDLYYTPKEHHTDRILLWSVVSLLFLEPFWIFSVWICMLCAVLWCNTLQSGGKCKGVLILPEPVRLLFHTPFFLIWERNIKSLLLAQGFFF